MDLYRHLVGRTTPVDLTLLGSALDHFRHEPPLREADHHDLASSVRCPSITYLHQVVLLRKELKLNPRLESLQHCLKTAWAYQAKR